MKNFRSLQLAINLHRQIANQKLPSHIRRQILDSSSSIAANLAEGQGKSSSTNQARYFEIAFASCKETQAWIQMAGLETSVSARLADKLGAHIYKLLLACRK